MDYSAILEQIDKTDDASFLTSLVKALRKEWLEAYDAMTCSRNSVYLIERGAFSFLFDLVSEVSDEQLIPHEDRVVCFFGTSFIAQDKRDAPRMRGYLGPTNMVFGSKYDKGHFISHAAGGGYLDSVNWFPQLRAVNRGWSDAGKRYRSMERYCAQHPGTFFFSRPIYSREYNGKASSTPMALEFGILRDQEFWVETFNNLER